MVSLAQMNEKALLVSRSSAVALAAVLPFSTALTNACLVVCLLGWLLSGRVKADCARLIRHPMTWAVLAFLAFLAISALWAQVPWKTSLAEISKYRKLLFLLLFTAIFWQEEVWKERMLTVLFASLFVLSVLCFGVALGVPGLPAMNPWQGAIVLKNHIAQGILLSLLVVLGCRWVYYGDRMWKRIWGGAGVVTALISVFYLANGRTGYVCAAVALVLSVFCMIKSWKLKGAMVLAAVVVVVAVGLTSERIQKRFEMVGEDVTQFEQGNSDTSSGLRLSFWQQSFEMVKKSPVWGIGAGAWRHEYRLGVGEPETKDNIKETGNPHNEYLNVVSQTGAIGFLLFVWFLWQAFRAGLTLSPADRTLLMGFSGMFLVGCFFNSLIFNFTEGNAFVLMLGVLLAMQMQPRGNQSHEN